MAEICIVMAVYNPNPTYLTEQITSFAQQTNQDFAVLFVIADGLSGDLVSNIAADAGITFTTHTPPTQLDAVRAFEFGLETALAATDAGLIALSDQDDIWHPERLAASHQALEQSGADLVHSDARLVDSNGDVTHPSMFAFEKRRKTPSLRGLFYRNNITGMTILMRRQLVEIALPFPPQSGVHFYHDLWLGLVANLYNGVHLVETPLVDYRQHGENVVGAVDQSTPKLPNRWAVWKGFDRSWLRRTGAGYGLARYLAGSLHGHAHAAMVTGITKHGDAYLQPTSGFMQRFGWGGAFVRDAAKLAMAGHFDLARIALKFAFSSVGRNLWVLRHALTEGRFLAADQFDDRLYRLSPGMAPKVPTHAAVIEHPPHAAPRVQKIEDIVDARKAPKWRPDFSAELPAFTILIPTLNPSEVFAGIATAVDIGLGLAVDGHHVRFITLDLPIASKAASERFLWGRIGAVDSATKNRISLHCSCQEDTIPAHADDIFMATAWWSAHVIQELVQDHPFSTSRFVYLIQDFEPNFYAWGPEYADAWASYAFEFEPIFNTDLLRQYFADQGFQFAIDDTISFRPSIDISRYTCGKRISGGARKRLALYGRPEVDRNMFPTAIEALSRFIAAHELGPEDIEIVSMGLKHDDVMLANGVQVHSLGKLAWEDYPSYLLGIDLGLCLMYSPHPSHPPIEMAASGARVVVNGFGPKDLSELSPAIISADPNATALMDALSAAWDMPTVTAPERQVDLASLGAPIEDAIPALSQYLVSAFNYSGDTTCEKSFYI